MDSSPSPSEYPTAANSVAVQVLHPPRCSGCHKREYICSCEWMRLTMLELMTALSHSRNFLYSMALKISPDFSVRDVGWFNTWDFSLEQTDSGSRFQPLFLPIIYDETPDRFQQSESIIWNRDTFRVKEMLDYIPAPRYICPKYMSGYRKDSPVGDGHSSSIEAYRKMSEEYHIDIESLDPMVFEQIPETKRFIYLKSLLYTLPVPDPFTKLNEIVLGITGQAAFSLIGYALTGSSSSSPALYFVVGATAIGFICTWIALTLKHTKKRPARILGKVGAMAAACAVIVAMGTVLPEKTIWISGIACLLTGVAMALA